MRVETQRRSVLFALLICCLCSAGCRRSEPTISFAAVPVYDLGGGDTSGYISGHIAHSMHKDRLIIFAESGDRWWPQPSSATPYTAIRQGGVWDARIHLGTEYAVVLVRDDLTVPTWITELPSVGGAVAALWRVPATPTPQMSQVHRFSFSGEEWEARSTDSQNGGARHSYSPQNVSVDREGRLHLRITRSAGKWVCSEVQSRRSLNYGNYMYRLSETAHLEPATMLNLSTWDEAAIEQQHREIDIHVSRWGDPQIKNGEFAVQPYFIPGNTYRFALPDGPVTMSMDWRPGEAHFIAENGGRAKFRETWDFTAGVPEAGNEHALLNFCEFSYSKQPLRNPAEVIIDRFQFLP